MCGRAHEACKPMASASGRPGAILRPGAGGAVRLAETWYEHVTGWPDPRPPLAGDVAAETCVVGGGLAGLGTALSLAERNRPVVLLEAARIGSGASGRNGGMASAGFNRDVSFLLAAVGKARAEKLYRLSLEGLALLRRRIEQGGIACGLVEGVVEASWFSDVTGADPHIREMNRLGARLEPLPCLQLRSLYRSRHFRGGFLDRAGFHLDPLALCHGLAARATALGVGMFEGTPVQSIHRDGAGWQVTTPRGQVRAAHLVLCTSAGRPGLVPELHRSTLPVHTHIVVTEPLGERLGEAIRAPYAVYDDRMATGYFRPLPGSRLLWGGRVDALGSPRRLEDRMRRDLACVFPQLADVRIDFAWSGAMGFARHRMPVVRPLRPGLWVATGFGGHGLNTTTLAGELVASALAEGDERWRLLESFGLPWNGGVLGPLAAQLFYRGYQLRDRLAGLAGRRRES
jgi:gamma-glutamylputrescine oxidase